MSGLQWRECSVMTVLLTSVMVCQASRHSKQAASIRDQIVRDLGMDTMPDVKNVSWKVF